MAGDAEAAESLEDTTKNENEDTTKTGTTTDVSDAIKAHGQMLDKKLSALEKKLLSLFAKMSKTNAAADAENQPEK